jgi:hypothetical protein
LKREKGPALSSNSLLSMFRLEVSIEILMVMAWCLNSRRRGGPCGRPTDGSHKGYSANGASTRAAPASRIRTAPGLKGRRRPIRVDDILASRNGPEMAFDSLLKTLRLSFRGVFQQTVEALPAASGLPTAADAVASIIVLRPQAYSLSAVALSAGQEFKILLFSR